MDELPMNQSFPGLRNPLQQEAEIYENVRCDNNEIKLLIVTNNKIPIVTATLFESSGSESNRHSEKRCCGTATTRLCFLAGLGMLSAVSAMCFLISIRIAYPNPRDHLPDDNPFGPRVTQLLWCNDPDVNPLDNFFQYPVSLLIWCNKALGITLAITTAILLMITIYLRHPMYDKPCLGSGNTSSNTLQKIKVRRNITLLIIGWLACINFILLAIFDILVRPWHDIFTISCFVSFIIYEMAHNYYLAFDIWRNRMYTWKSTSTSIVTRQYAVLTSSALFIGVTSNILTVCGFLLKGKYGPPFQWMTILSILGYFFPVYLLITIRDYVLLRQK